MDPPSITSKPKSCSQHSPAVNGFAATNGHKAKRERRGSVNTGETERLTESIRSSSYKRQRLDLDANYNLHPVPYENDDDGDDDDDEAERPQEAGKETSADLEIPARDARDDESVPPRAAVTKRRVSPITNNPPIDFDGLSWPSELPLLRDTVPFSLVKYRLTDDLSVPLRLQVSEPENVWRPLRPRPTLGWKSYVVPSGRYWNAWERIPKEKDYC